MNNLLLTLAVGVLFILIVHSVLRFLTQRSSIQSAFITLAVMCSVYIPLLIIDWPSVDIFAIQFSIYGVTIYLLTILHSQAIIHKQKVLAGSETKKRWHWAPLLIISFFVVVVSVDSVFITIAQQGSDSLLRGLFIPPPKSGGAVTSYFPGIIEHNYHQKEDQYNQHQERLDKQRKRGWQVKYGWSKKPISKKLAIFLLSLKDEKSQPITQAIITGSFQRGNTSKQDKPITLRETKAGLYQTNIVLDHPGRWELLLKVKSPQGDYDIKATTDVAD